MTDPNEAAKEIVNQDPVPDDLVDRIKEKVREEQARKDK